MKITAADTGLPIPPQTEEYLRRNLLHCKAVGVAAGLRAVRDRLRTLKRKPLLLVGIINRELEKAELMADEMARHRDEVKL